MKKYSLAIIFMFTIMIVFNLTVFAQGKPINNSQIKIETVIQNFDSISSIKIIYSTSDKYYLILLDTDPRIEYFIVLDSLGRITHTKATNCKDTSFLRKSENRQLNYMLKKAGNIFSLARYNNLFDYDYEHITTAIGKMSYFAVLDYESNIYAEYTLPTITTPLPIDMNLLIYLIRRLSNEIYDYYTRDSVAMGT